MKELFRLKRNSDVMSHLGSLPKGLQSAYQRLLEDISAQEGSAPIIAARALKWVMNSWRPLHPSELAVLVCQSGESLDPFDQDVDIKYILGCCRNLLVVTSQSPIICRFSHLSVQEYLESHPWPNEPDFAMLTAVCLRLLMLEESRVPSLSDFRLSNYTTTAVYLSESEDRGNWQGYVDHWYKHVVRHSAKNRTADKVFPIQELIQQFFGDPAGGSDSYKRWAARVSGSNPLSAQARRGRSWDDTSPLITLRSWLHHGAGFGAVVLGLNDTLIEWLESHTLDPNMSCADGSLLHLAALGNGTEVCAILLRYGADVNVLCPRGATPLLTALTEGEETTAGYLLKIGRADANKGRVGEYSALGIAASKSRPDMVKLILETGGDPNTTHVKSALHAAIDALFQGPLIMKMLLDNGADKNFCEGQYMTPLAYAVDQRRLEAVDYLLKNGADVNLFRPLYSVLYSFRDEKEYKILRLLVDAGALDYILGLPSEQRTDLDSGFRRIALIVKKELEKIERQRASPLSMY